MAKNAKDKSGDIPLVFTPPTFSQARNVITQYRELGDKKKGPGNQQKELLDQFNRQHSCPPWITKILIQFDKIDDEGDKANAWRALIHMGKALKFDAQTDIEDVIATQKDDEEAEEVSKADDDKVWEGSDPAKAKKPRAKKADTVSELAH